MNIQSQTRIGTIGNYYGHLEVCESDGNYFWSIDDYCGTRYEEIPESLYRALIEFEGKK